MIECLDCEVGHFTSAELARLDASKMKHKARKAPDSEKRSRRRRRAVRKGFQDSAAEREGVTYEAGGF